MATPLIALVPPEVSEGLDQASGFGVSIGLLKIALFTSEVVYLIEPIMIWNISQSILKIYLRWEFYTVLIKQSLKNYRIKTLIDSRLRLETTGCFSLRAMAAVRPETTRFFINTQNGESASF